MFYYLKPKDLSGVPFIVLDKPVKCYVDNYAFRQEKANEKYPELPKRIHAYLIDEEKPPFASVQDINGQDIPNLVIFNKEGESMGEPHKVIMKGEEKEVSPLMYNFFNYPAPVMVTKEDGSVVEYRRKWLDGVYRANVKLVTPTEIEVWDKESKGMKRQLITHAKVDFSFGLYSKKMAEKLDTIREAKENPNLQMSEIEFTVGFDGNASPGDMYTVKAKASKTTVNVEEELKAFVIERKEFVAPDNPFA